jgi:probable HAF family extracellular repeat protein
VVLAYGIGPLGSLPCPTSICGASPPQAYIFKNGTFTKLPPLSGDVSAYANDLNNAGQIVGGSYSAGGTETAVTWMPDLSVVNLGIGIASPGSNAEADVISDGGKIGGVSYNATSTFPTFFDGKGGASNPCGATVQGYFRNGINDSGVAVGDEILSAGGTAAMTCPPFTVVATPSNPAFLNFGFDINNAGTVVGRLSPGPTKSIFHPFMSQHGVTTDLGTLFPGDANAVGAAFAINNNGMIVGFSAQANAVIGPPPIPPVNPRAFVYANGKMVDLNTLLPGSCANWTLITANDVNDNGMIVGTAFVGGYPNGSEHAYLLIPHS